MILIAFNNIPYACNILYSGIDAHGILEALPPPNHIIKIHFIKE